MLSRKYCGTLPIPSPTRAQLLLPLQLIPGGSAATGVRALVKSSMVVRREVVVEESIVMSEFLSMG